VSLDEVRSRLGEPDFGEAWVADGGCPFERLWHRTTSTPARRRMALIH
jgi:hypothetical protein